MLERLKRWRLGVERISADDIIELKKCREGELIRVEPSDKEIPFDSVHNALSSLWNIKESTISFEIWSGPRRPRFYFWSSRHVALKELEAQLSAFYPKSKFLKAEEHFPEVNVGSFAAGARVVLEGEPLHLKALEDFKYDPLVPFLKLLQQLDASILQTIFRPLKEVPSDLEDTAVDRFCGGEKPEKLRVPLFECLIRVVGASQDYRKAREIVELISESFEAFGGRFSRLKPEVRSFRIPLIRDNLLKDVAKRRFPRFSRKKFVVSPKELASIVHLPAKSEVGAAPAPTHSTPQEVSLGRTPSGSKVITSIDDLGSVYVCGAPGTGKSTFLINTALQAIRSNRAVFVIDPHGDMAQDLARSVKPGMISRVSYLDPTEFDFRLNPLELPAKSEGKGEAAERLIGEITEMFRRIYGKKYWGPSLNRIFQKSIRALYRSRESPTFEDVLKLLRREEDFGSDQIKEFQEYLSKLPTERIDAVLNKVEPLVKNETLHSFFCGKSSIDFDELCKPGKLVILRLPKAAMTGQTLSIFGAALVTKLWFHIASRARGERVPLMLIMDEFQNFAGLETLGVMLAEGRKYKVQLVLAHQHLGQLKEREVSPEDVLSNTMTKVAFRTLGKGSKILAKNLEPSRKKELMGDLTNLPDGQAIVKLKARFGEEPAKPFKLSTLPPPEKEFFDLEKLISRAKERYSPREEEKPETEREERELEPDVQKLLKAVQHLRQQGKRAKTSAVLKELRPEIEGLTGTKLSQLIDRAQSSGFVERKVVKKGKGRPSTLVKLTEKGRKALGITSLGGAKAGGELHRAMIHKVAEWYRKSGYEVEVPRQAGKKRQPDLIVYPEHKPPFAIEVETSAKHPEQVRKNYRKNLQNGMDVIFITPSEKVKQKVERILKDSGMDAVVYVF